MGCLCPVKGNAQNSSNSPNIADVPQEHVLSTHGTFIKDNMSAPMILEPNRENGLRVLQGNEDVTTL